MATMNLTLNKLVNNDFNSGDTIEPNKWSGGATYSAVMVFNALTDGMITVNSATPIIGSIKVGGGNLLTEEARFDFEFGEYNGSTFTAKPGWTGSFTVSEGTVSNKSCTIDNGNFGCLKGTQLAYRLTVSSNNSSRVAKTTLSNFGLSIDCTVHSQCTITLDANGGVCSVSSITKYESQTYDVFDIKPTKTGYTFKHWSTVPNDTDGTYKINSWDTVKGNITLYAQYDANSYTISTAVSPSGTGTVTGGGTYDYDSTQTLTAVASTGFRFVKWQDGNTQNPRSITVKGNATYTAYFEVDKINKIYVGTSQPKAIYIGTQEVKAIYIGTTKVYG